MGLDVFFSFFSRSCLTFRCLVLPGDYPSDRTGWLRRSSCRATRCVHFPFLFLVAFGPRVALRRPAANDKCRDCPPSANCLLHHDGLLLFLLPLRILFSFFLSLLSSSPPLRSGVRILRPRTFCVRHLAPFLFPRKFFHNLQLSPGLMTILWSDLWRVFIFAEVLLTRYFPSLLGQAERFLN